MNHFLLWVGTPGSIEQTGRRLLTHFKTVGAVSESRGKGWSLISASQKDGSGAFEDERVRHSIPGLENRSVAWFGHAWSAHGARPSFEALCEEPDITPQTMVERIRESSDGVYAVIIADTQTGDVALAADCLGTFHIYFRQFDDGLAASNSSALLAALPPKVAFDATGVQEFCSQAVANEDRSIWQSVRKLRGSQILHVSADGRKPVLIQHRPLLAGLGQVDVTLDLAVPAVYDAISKSISMLARHGGRGAVFQELPWVADLTGGNDSRALMAALLSNRVPVVSTVTGSPGSEDVVIGVRVAQLAGISSIVRAPAAPLRIEELFDSLRLTDGEFNAIEFAGIAKVHRSHRADGLQFSVNGSYGETGRGYPWRLGPKAVFLPDRLAGALSSKMPIDARAQGQKRFKASVPVELFKSSLRVDWEEHGGEMIQRLLNYADGLPQCAQLDLVHVDLRMERWQGRIASSTNQLWPAVSPWGFREPLLRLLSASPLARRNSLLTRAFTAAYAPALADEILFTGNPARPFTWGQALKFLPAVGWYGRRAGTKLAARFAPPTVSDLPTARMRQPHLCEHREIQRYLAEPALAETGLFSSDVLRTALNPDKGMSESGYTLWQRLLTLELALRQHLNA